MKNNVNVSKEKIDSILKKRNLIPEEGKKQYSKNEVVSALSQNVFKEKNETNKKNYSFSGFIFNVYKDKSNNFTRFIASIDEIQQHIEYYIYGTDNTIGDKKGFGETLIESDEIQPVKVLILDGIEYQVYDPKSKKVIENNEKEKNEKISNWINSLSFYNPESTFNRISRKKLNVEEIEELISSIKRSENIDNQKKYLYIDYIRKQKYIRMSQLSELDNMVYKANPRIKR